MKAAREHLMCSRALLVVTCISLFASRVYAGTAAPGWWNGAWPYRVQIDCPAGEADVAEVTLMLAGRTTPDGRDLRMFDEHGRPRNFEIIHHDPKLTTLLQFAVPPGKPITVWAYFGNPKAPGFDPTVLASVPSGKAGEVRARWQKEQADRQSAIKLQALLQERLDGVRRAEQDAVKAGAAPPLIANLRWQISELERQLRAIRIPPETPEPDDPTKWHPRRGLLLRVYRKPQPVCPRTLNELKQLVSRRAPEGAAFRSAVSDGFNPFGESQHYISVYDGYLSIDPPGEYAFCSASSDGSWVVVNDRTLVVWPGLHGWEGSARGQRNGRITLEKGIAHVVYYHEAGTSQHLAFLGWKPPGADRFSAIPEAQWLSIRSASAAGYEGRGKPLLAVPDVRVASTYWVRDTDAQQATLVECADRSQSTAGRITLRRWTFGDGLDGAGPKVRHVFFRTGRPEVELTVADNKGNQDSVACSLRIFKVDVQSNYFQYGNAAQYTKTAAGYDIDKMQREDLELYADFWGKLEEWPEHARAVEALLRRFPDSLAVPRLAVSAAEAYASPQAYNPKRAVEMLERAIRAATDPQARRSLMMRRAHLLAWGLADYKAAETLYQDLRRTSEANGGRTGKEGLRDCLIGLGDVALLTSQYDQAAGLYRQAEAITVHKPEKAEEFAKTGSYPYSVEDLLARGEFEWASKLIDQWEDEFPSQKLEGLTFFLRGKVLFVEHPCEQAVRCLALAGQVAPRAVHVPEAVWLHANCLMAIGRYEEALGGLRRIRADFTQSEFFTRAADKIKECETRLKEAKNAKPG